MLDRLVLTGCELCTVVPGHVLCDAGETILVFDTTMPDRRLHNYRRSLLAMVLCMRRRGRQPRLPDELLRLVDDDVQTSVFDIN